MKQSRTNKSILNSIVALLAYFTSAAIAFFSRKVFLENIGPEILGLRTTMSNLLSMFGLAELGLGIAIGFFLYKPLHDNDTRTVNEIITVQAWFYRKLSVVFLVSGLILMAFLPLIFSDFEGPLWYAYATFALLLWEVLMSYLINFRGLIFGASQNSYRLTINTQGVVIVKSLLQVVVMLYVDNPYPYYLLLEFIVSLIGIFILEYMINRDFPWLRPDLKQGRSLLKKHPEIIKKTKEIFVHKFAGICAGNVAPLIIWKYTSLVVIAYYSNYTMVVANLNAISSAVFGSIGASIGNLVAEGNREKIFRFFWEFLALRNFVATIICFIIYNFSHPFIILWVGAESELDNITLLLITTTAFVSQSRATQDAFLAAKGLYQDVWAPIIEASLNIGCGILFGHFWGLPGVLLGTLISYIVIIVVWKLFFLFRTGFEISVWIYWRSYAKYLLVALLSIVLGTYLVRWSEPDYSSWGSFVLNASLYSIAFSSILLGIYLLMSDGARRMSLRFVEIGRKMVGRLRG